MYYPGFQKSNIREQDQSLQSRPTIQFSESQSPQSTGFNTQNTQTFDAQPQSWQSKIVAFRISPILFSLISFSNDPKSTTFTRYNFRLSRLLDIILLNIIEQNQQTFIEPNTPTQKVIRLQGLFDLPMSPRHQLSFIQVFKNQMFVNKMNQRKIDQPFNSVKVNHHKQPDSMHNHNHGKVRFSFSKIHLFYSQ
jgi:hypothetical protein